MKRIANAPSGNLYPYCPGKQDFEDVLQEVIAGMAHVDTSQEDLCVRNFQSRVIVPDPRTNADKAQLVLRWCVNNGLGEQFREALKTYDALAPRREGGDWLESVDLTIGGVAPEKLPFFIAVLPHCPQIKDIDLPLPATSGGAKRLAEALSRNSGLKRLQLHVSEKAPPDSTVLHWLFSHHTARANALSEVRIDIKDKPAGDTDWMPPLCHALSTHLQAESAQLTLPWDDRALKLLGSAVSTSRCLSSLTLGGNVTGSGTLLMLGALKNSGGQLKSLSFPDSSFDKERVDEVIEALGYIQSLTQLDLGNTLLTADQKKSITTMLERNAKNIERWQLLGGSWRV